MIELGCVVLILGQAVYWLFWKDRSEDMDSRVWDACLYPGEYRG
jgi:hypothetical protein